MQVTRLTTKIKSDLDKKFQKVLKTPAGFDFFVAIHNFVKYIELNPALSAIVLSSSKTNQELNIPGKYINLKRIYQGLEDANNKSGVDLGHERYTVIVELNKIQNNDVSDSNSFWRKRELFRKLAGEIHQRLNPDLV